LAFKVEVAEIIVSRGQMGVVSMDLRATLIVLVEFLVSPPDGVWTSTRRPVRRSIGRRRVW
jgi:hypothetical protein